MILLLLQLVVDDFSGDASKWIARDATAAVEEGALTCSFAKAGATGSTDHIPREWKDVGAVLFRVRAAEERTFEVELRGDGRYWRKVTVKAGDWQTVTIPLYRFRADGVPASLASLGFVVEKKKLADVLAALREEASRRRAVETVLKSKSADFEVEWRAFCRERYK